MPLVAPDRLIRERRERGSDCPPWSASCLGDRVAEGSLEDVLTEHALSEYEHESDQLGLFDGTEYDSCATLVPWLEPMEDRLYDPPLTQERLDPDGVLETVNAMRQARGLEPLLGLRLRGAVACDQDRCVLARAVDCTVTHEHLTFDDLGDAHWVADALGLAMEHTWVELPPPFVPVISRFDRGELSSSDLQVIHRAQLAFEIAVGLPGSGGP